MGGGLVGAAITDVVTDNVMEISSGDVDAGAAMIILSLLIVYMLGARQTIGKYVYWVGVGWLVLKLMM